MYHSDMCGALSALCSWINMQDDDEVLDVFFKSRSLCILFTRIFANSSALLSDQGVRVGLMSLLTVVLTPIVTSIRQREGDDHDDDSVLLEVTVICICIFISVCRWKYGYALRYIYLFINIYTYINTDIYIYQYT